MKDRPLRELSEWAERVWEDDRCNSSPLLVAAESARDDELEPVLLDAISREVGRDRDFLTLGRPARNTVTEVTRGGVQVQTARSTKKTGLPAEIPAWMFNIAWDYLNEWGEPGPYSTSTSFPLARISIRLFYRIRGDRRRVRGLSFLRATPAGRWCHSSFVSCTNPRGTHEAQESVDHHHRWRQRHRT